MLRSGVTREWWEKSYTGRDHVEGMIRSYWELHFGEQRNDGAGGNRRRKMGSSYCDIGLEGYGIWLLLGSTVGVKEDYDDSVLGGIIRAIGELDYFSAYIRLREPDKSEDKAEALVEKGAEECKLARKLLEPLMRSATANKTSVKLGILASGGCAIWSANPKKEPQGETYNGGNPPSCSCNELEGTLRPTKAPWGRQLARRS
ncbi:hypothetical protein BHE74_00015001 [Ensete ventricosum]|nr:hypothetical protein GW17_00030609 [Ensete ventricosum]RWW76877.1 hypothetical protein BHE74_00015001 [Ensete ventricosum]